jgi:hypothetical protein
MNVTQAIEARARIETRMARRAARESFVEHIAADPYHCESPTGGHHPTGDNPMRTGRCLNCRAFIGWNSHRGAWRTVTITQASRWGMLGRRRT